VKIVGCLFSPADEYVPRQAPVDPLPVYLQDRKPGLLDRLADGPIVGIDHPSAGDEDPPQLGEAPGQKLIPRTRLDQGRPSAGRVGDVGLDGLDFEGWHAASLTSSSCSCPDFCAACRECPAPARRRQ